MRLKQRLNPELERKLKDAVFVGRLVTAADLAGTLINSPVSFQESSDYIQFYIKCLSPIPEELSEQFQYQNNIIFGSTFSANNKRKLAEWTNYLALYHFEIIDKIKGFLQNKLIAFRLSTSQTNDSVFVELLKIEKIPPDSEYLMIPSPDLGLNESHENFKQKLVGETKPFTLKHYPNIFTLPKLIYCHGDLYHVALKQTYNVNTYTQEKDIAVKYLENIGEQFFSAVDLRIDNHLFFVNVEKFTELESLLAINGETLMAEIEQEPLLEIAAHQEVDIINHEVDESLSEVAKGELSFLEQLNRNTKSRGLYYNEEDLHVFHISVKTNLLSIIGGMSGTGKTQLAKIYGETLGLEVGKQLLMIPVSPSYHEPNDILGYLNPTTGVYYESETGLVSLLLEAEENEDQLYMVIFDEMNLSQVEHWFSPFISLLEIEEENRYLSLFNSNSYCVNNRYKPKVKIGNNIIFVGTVNFDETTKDFSDRLLDRTNVIIPTKRSFKDSVAMIRQEDFSQINFQSYSIDTLIYRNHWHLTDEEHQYLAMLTDEEIDVLDELHRMIHEDNQQSGVSFRVAIGIARFLANIPLNYDGQPLIERSRAFDIQLSQRVLTKIKGLSAYVEPLVGMYSQSEYEPGEIYQFLQAMESAERSFEVSLNLLKSKAKELMLYGYAN